MGNWIDELEKQTKEPDRQIKVGAKRYDTEVNKWRQLKDDNDDENDESDEDESEENEDEE